MIATIRAYGQVVAVTLIAAVAAIAGILAIGASAHDVVAEQDRFRISLATIECNFPDDRSRDTFLTEVHYYGRLPERLPFLDPGLPDQLRIAFLRHPRVEAVERITFLPGGRIQVALTLTP